MLKYSVLRELTNQWAEARTAELERMYMQGLNKPAKEATPMTDFQNSRGIVLTNHEVRVFMDAAEARINQLETAGRNRFNDLELKLNTLLARTEPEPYEVIDTTPEPEPTPEPVPYQHPLVGRTWNSFARQAFNRSEVPSDIKLRVDVGEWPEDASGCPVLWVGPRDDNSYGVAPSWRERSFYAILTNGGRKLKFNNGGPVTTMSLLDGGRIERIFIQFTGTSLFVRIESNHGSFTQSIPLQRGDGELAAWLGTHNDQLTPWDIPIDLTATVISAS